MPLTELFKIDLSFNDADHYSEAVRSWNLESRQLGRGQFGAEIRQLGCRNYILGHAQFGQKLHQVGMPPAGGWTFLIPNREGMQLLCRGQQQRGNQLVCLPWNCEMETVSHDFFDLLFITVSQERMEQKLAQYELEADLFAGRELCDVDSRLLLVIQFQLRRLIGLSLEDVIRDQGAIEAELDSWLDYVIHAWSRGARKPRVSVPVAQAKMLSRVIEHIDQHQKELIRLEDLCAHAGVSARTLQYAFKRKFQMTPKQYMQACRLDGVRKAIRKQPSASISQLASEWGFWHMGQFAADYRKLFGVRPSESLSSRG